jgi:hypothetical protein
MSATLSTNDRLNKIQRKGLIENAKLTCVSMSATPSTNEMVAFFDFTTIPTIDGCGGVLSAVLAAIVTTN